MIRSLRPLLAMLACAACASAPRPPPAPAPTPGPTGAPDPAMVLPEVAPPARAGLQLMVAPPDAEVEIEGVLRAPAAGLAAKDGGFVPLPPGVHRVSVRRAGYHTWRAEVSVGTAVERIEVTLTPMEPR